VPAERLDDDSGLSERAVNIFVGQAIEYDIASMAEASAVVVAKVCGRHMCRVRRRRTSATENTENTESFHTGAQGSRGDCACRHGCGGCRPAGPALG